MQIRRRMQTFSWQKLTSAFKKCQKSQRTHKRDKGEEFTQEDSIPFILWGTRETTTTNWACPEGHGVDTNWGWVGPGNEYVWGNCAMSCVCNTSGNNKGGKLSGVHVCLWWNYSPHIFTLINTYLSNNYTNCRVLSMFHSQLCVISELSEDPSAPFTKVMDK